MEIVGSVSSDFSSTWIRRVDKSVVTSSLIFWWGFKPLDFVWSFLSDIDNLDGSIIELPKFSN